MSNSRFFAITPVDQKMLFRWASLNGMKLIGKPIGLPSCKSAWELDTQYNENIHLGTDHLLGRGRMKFMNGEEGIGFAYIDQLRAESTGITHVVISPFYQCDDHSAI